LKIEHQEDGKKRESERELKTGGWKSDKLSKEKSSVRRLSKYRDDKIKKHSKEICKENHKKESDNIAFDCTFFAFPKYLFVK